MMENLSLIIGVIVTILIAYFLYKSNIKIIKNLVEAENETTENTIRRILEEKEQTHLEELNQKVNKKIVEENTSKYSITIPKGK